jgi:eukaryotic-like serine/threonine-protein kinase
VTLEVGTMLGRYEIVAVLGVGGMGEVYRARDSRLKRDVAVKVLSRCSAADPDLARRFEQEARAAGSLNHPNVMAVYDAGSHEGVPYLVSELLEGETLRDRLDVGPLPARKAVDLAIHIAAGLAAAHAKGIVHRDLKPENVLLTRDGQAKILDFGVAKLLAREEAPEGTGRQTVPGGTTPGIVLGTVGYMSPEQVRGEAVDVRSDLFSFGTMLYEMLSGQRAFRRDSAVETMNAILKDEPPELAEATPDMPPLLLRIVQRCLEKQPDERFQTARDLSFALEEVRGSGRARTAPTAAAPAVRPRYLRPALAALAVALAVVVVFNLGRRHAVESSPTFRQITFRRGVVSAARFARDGHTVYFSAAWGGQPQEICAAEAASPEARPLGLGRARLVATSPGELALILLAGGEGEGTLARVPLGSSAPREVLEDVLEADWTADGTRIAVTRSVEEGEHLEYPIGTTLYTTPSWVGSLRISPSGDRVAFVDHPVPNDSRGDIAVVDRKGGKRVLSASWNDAFGLAWSADGREVLFTAARSGSAQGLYAVGMGGRERLLARVPGRLVLHDVAADGRVLVTHPQRRREMLLLLPDETRERDISWLDYSVAADLSADGRTVLFGESGEGGGAGYSVYLRRTDSSAPVRLGEGQPTSLSPDGAQALSVLHGAEPQLVVLPTGAGQAVTLPRGAISQYRWAWWFPDGRHVLVEGSEAGKQRRLYVQETPGGAPRPLTPEGTSAPRPNAIFPDGTAVTATCKAPRPSWCLYPVTGGEPRPIAGIEPGESPVRWSADGRFLYVRGSRFQLPLTLSRVELATGRRETIRELGPVDRAGVTSIADVFVTPDGKTCVYHYLRTLADLYLVEVLR